MTNEFTKIIFNILMEEDKPLNVYELAFHFEEADVNAIDKIIKNEISLVGEKSLFFHAGNRKYGLRMWLDDTTKYSEVFTSAIGKINPLEEIIAVFDNSKLERFIGLNVFTPCKFKSDDFKDHILPLERKIAESEKALVQLVSCFVLRYQDSLASFYKTKFQPEKRLNYDKKCINFGGHIAFEEFFSLFDALDPHSFSPFVIRELLEEVEILTDIDVDQIGFLYDKSTDIGKQHLGLVYEVNLNSKNISIKEKKLFSNLNFESINELSSELDSFDSWSKEIVKYYANIK